MRTAIITRKINAVAAIPRGVHMMGRVNALGRLKFFTTHGLAPSAADICKIIPHFRVYYYPAC